MSTHRKRLVCEPIKLKESESGSLFRPNPVPYGMTCR